MAINPTEPIVRERSGRLFCGRNCADMIFAPPAVKVSVSDDILHAENGCTATIKDDVLCVVGLCAVEITDGVLTIS